MPHKASKPRPAYTSSNPNSSGVGHAEFAQPPGNRQQTRASSAKLERASSLPATSKADQRPARPTSKGRPATSTNHGAHLEGAGRKPVSPNGPHAARTSEGAVRAPW